MTDQIDIDIGIYSKLEKGLGRENVRKGRKKNASKRKQNVVEIEDEKT